MSSDHNTSDHNTSYYNKARTTTRAGYLVSLALVLLLCLGAGTTNAKQLKIATLAPEGSSWMTEVRKAAEAVKERTAGRVALRFYPGGAMGSEEAVLRKIRIGQLHGSAMTSGSLAALYPDIQIYSLPLLFESYEEVDYTRRRMDQVLMDQLSEKGIVSYGIIEGGFAYLLSLEEIRAISDLKGRKAWLREGDSVGRAIVKAAGLAPIPLELTNVLMGLQTGLIDTVAGPPVGAVALQWFTKVKYLTDLPLIYTYGTIIIGDKALRGISPEDQAILNEELQAACKRLDKAVRKENEAAMQALVKQGVTVVNASDAMLDEWRRMAAIATESLLEDGSCSRAMHEEIVAIIEEKRKASADQES